MGRDADGAPSRQGGGAERFRRSKMKAARTPGHRDNSARNSEEFLTSVSLRNRFGEPVPLPGVRAAFL